MPLLRNFFIYKYLITGKKILFWNKISKPNIQQITHKKKKKKREKKLEGQPTFSPLIYSPPSPQITPTKHSSHLKFLILLSSIFYPPYFHFNQMHQKSYALSVGKHSFASNAKQDSESNIRIYFIHEKQHTILNFRTKNRKHTLMW